MKTKLLILFGIIIAVVSVVAVAERQNVSDWEQELLEIQESRESVSNDVSKLLQSVQGIQTEEVAYIDNGVMYFSRPNESDEKTSRRKISDSAEHIFDRHDSKVLFVRVRVVNETLRIVDLLVLDTVTGVETKISDSVGDSVFSNSGKLIATNNIQTGGIDLFDVNGVLLKRFDTYGGWAVFSPNDKQLAYLKLAKPMTASFEIDLPGNILGIAVYDLETGKEKLITNHERDGAPVFFSPNGKKLYFNSSRTSVASLWVVDLASGKVEQLTNKEHVHGYHGDFAPYVNKDPLVSSDGLTIVSAAGDGSGILIFNQDGTVASQKKLPEITDPHWLVKDEIIAYRVQGSEGKYWEFIFIK